MAPPRRRPHRRLRRPPEEGLREGRRRPDGAARHGPRPGRPRRRPRLRDLPLERRTGLPLRQRRRRHRDEDHARDPRRGPPLQHLEAPRALQGLRRRTAEVRPHPAHPQDRRPGQDVQARQGRPHRGIPAAPLPPFRRPQLPLPARLDARRRQGSAADRRDHQAVRDLRGPPVQRPLRRAQDVARQRADAPQPARRRVRRARPPDPARDQGHRRFGLRRPPRRGAGHRPGEGDLARTPAGVHGLLLHR